MDGLRNGKFGCGWRGRDLLRGHLVYLDKVLAAKILARVRQIWQIWVYSRVRLETGIKFSQLKGLQAMFNFLALKLSTSSAIWQRRLVANHGLKLKENSWKGCSVIGRNQPTRPQVRRVGHENFDHFDRFAIFMKNNCIVRKKSIDWS